MSHDEGIQTVADGIQAHLQSYAHSVRAPLLQEIAALRARVLLVEERLRAEERRTQRLRAVIQTHSRAGSLDVNQPLANASSPIQLWIGLFCFLLARSTQRPAAPSARGHDHDYPDTREDDEVKVRVQARCGTADVGSTAAAAVSSALSQAWQRAAKKNHEALFHERHKDDDLPWPATLATCRQDYNVVVRVDTKLGVHSLSDPDVRQHVRRITQGSAPSAVGSASAAERQLNHPASLSGAGSSLEAFVPSRSPTFSPLASPSALRLQPSEDLPGDVSALADDASDGDLALAMCLTQVKLEWAGAGPKAVLVICKPTSGVMETFVRTLLELFRLGLTVVVEPKVFAIILAQLHRSGGAAFDTIAEPPSRDTSLRSPAETSVDDVAESSQSLDEPLFAHDAEAAKPRKSFASTLTKTISRVVSKTARGASRADEGAAIPTSDDNMPKLRRITPVVGLLSQSSILRELSESASHPSTADLVSLRGPTDIKMSAALEAQEMADALHRALHQHLPQLALALDADVAGGAAGVSALEWMRTVKVERSMTTLFGGKLVAWSTVERAACVHEKASVPREVAIVLDAVVTLGGDGTMLWACKMMGNHPVPPIIPFAMGSLGFMTPFSSDALKPVLQAMTAGGVQLLLRHRLECWVLRNCEMSGESRVRERHVILNDVAVHRGTSSFLTNMEVYCDDTFVTNVQGDGLLLATPTGSTAYSLAAGGSMVHPAVPGILFTPICPHSLSFRPLVFPDHVQLRVQVPENVRNSEMHCSFDGSDHIVLRPGDALVVQLSKHPVPTVCDVNVSHDWFCSVREGLYWNLRKMQGVHEGKPPVAESRL